MARSERRPIHIPQFQIAREHIFQDDNQDTELDKQLESRVESEGGEFTRWWSLWQSRQLASDNPDSDVDMQDLSQTGSAPQVARVPSTSASSSSSRLLSSQKVQVSRTSTPWPKTPVAGLRRTPTQALSPASSSKSQASIGSRPIIRRFVESNSPDKHDPEPLRQQDMHDLSQTALTPVARMPSTSASSSSSRLLSGHKMQVLRTSTPWPKTPVAGLRRTPSQALSSASSSKSQASIGSRPIIQRFMIESHSPDKHDPEALPHKTPYQTIQKLKKISDDWNKATSSVGAAPIWIVNELDSEVLFVPQGFQYVEQGYYSEYNRSKEDEFMSGCSCSGRSCEHPESCCVAQMDTQQSFFPYSESGLFTFALCRSTCIIECNKMCLCDKTCITRVAQKPRQVPIEIFKTARCGWGVRATVTVRRGQVIGTYSGELIQRSKADNLSGIRGEYVFDLDHLEGGEDEPPPELKFSVDGYDKGNWGRFINHSCEPNLQVWPVLYDTAEQNKPYLAFIAKKNIPPRVELTLDYNPKLQYVPSNSKGKGRAQGCLCGSSLCRGRMS